MENSYLPYRYYTSVGIYQGYNSDSRQHFVLVRSSQENLCENEKRYHIVSLDEFQFMIWYACHGEIISEDDMYEIASKMWEKADGHKKPLLRCVHELEELQLLSMKESATKEECMLNLVQSIQPFQQSLSMCHNFKSFASYMLKRVKVFLGTVFASEQQRSIMRYLQNHPFATLRNYFLEYFIMRSQQNYTEFLCDVNVLLCKGYIIPIGWSASTLQ